MKKEYQDRIEDYLLNRMSNDERTLFEQDLKMDAELREQYEFISMVKIALMFENIEKDVLSVDSDGEDIAAATTSENEKSDCNYEKNIIIDIRKKHTQSRFSKSHVIFWISGIAAMIIVGLFIFNNLPSYNDSDLLETAYIQPSDSILSPAINKVDMCSEGHSEMETNISNGCGSQPHHKEDIHNNHKYKSSAGRGKMNIETLLAMGDYDKALSKIEENKVRVNSELMLLEREINSRGDEDIAEKLDSLENKLSQLQYWKAKALIGLNRKAEAIKLLDEIRHSESKYKQQADSLYKVLR